MLLLLREIDLLSLSGSYEGAAGHRLLLPFTGVGRWQANNNSTAEPKCVCARVCMRACVRKCVVFPSLKTEICQWLLRLSTYLEFLQIPNSQWQDFEKETWEGGRERGVVVFFCQRYALWDRHRCNFSQDKGSSVQRNMLLHSHHWQGAETSSCEGKKKKVSKSPKPLCCD